MEMEISKGAYVLILAKPENTTWVGGTIKQVLKKGYKIKTKVHKPLVFIPKLETHRIRFKKKSGTDNPKNKSKWPPNHEALLQLYHNRLKNPELAKMMGVGLTVLRNELYRLGLQRCTVTPWTEVQTRFLKVNFQKMGDQSIADYFQEHWPKLEKWTRQKIWKKRKRLNLKRTADEIEAIERANKPIVAAKVSKYMTSIWKRVKRREQMGMSILFTKHRSNKATSLKAPTPVYMHNPSHHIEF